jgi:hypothetical protein
MVVKGPTGYEFWAACGSKEEAQRTAKARQKQTGKKHKVKKLGYRNYGIFESKYGGRR